jgi:phage gpG-like protein
MLSININGFFPQISTDFSAALVSVEELMLKSVQMNLTMGGRPEPFKVKNANSTPLVGSGKMYKGVKSEHTVDSATVYMDKNVVSKSGFFYPKSLQDGARVPEVDGKLMVFVIDGHTIFTYHRKAYTRPAFPFMIFQENDKERIADILMDSVFSKEQISFSSQGE